MCPYGFSFSKSVLTVQIQKLTDRNSGLRVSSESERKQIIDDEFSQVIKIMEQIFVPEVEIAEAKRKVVDTIFILVVGLTVG